MLFIIPCRCAGRQQEFLVTCILQLPSLLCLFTSGRPSEIATGRKPWLHFLLASLKWAHLSQARRRGANSLCYKALYQPWVLPFWGSHDIIHEDVLVTACLKGGKKGRKIELPHVLDRIVEKDKKIKILWKTSPFTFSLLPLCLLEFNSPSHLFNGVHSAMSSRSPSLLDAIFLPASKISVSLFSLPSLSRDFRTFWSLAALFFLTRLPTDERGCLLPPPIKPKCLCLNAYLRSLCGLERQRNFQGKGQLISLFLSVKMMCCASRMICTI